MTLLLAVSLGGCASAAELALPAPSVGAAEFVGLTLRERREAVLAELADDARHAAEPDCRVARLAPIDGSRRAFPLERCEHEVVVDGHGAPVLADRPIRALVTHFVDERLVRIDVVTVDGSVADDGDVADGGASGDAGAMALGSVRARLDERLGAHVPGRAEGIDRWALGDDDVELARTPDGAIRLSVIDGETLAMLPELGESDPTAKPD